MTGTGEIKYAGRTRTNIAAGSLILIYQGLEEENLDQKSPGPPGWELMQRANSSLITEKQEMLKNQTLSLGNQTVIDDSTVHLPLQMFVVDMLSSLLTLL
jgi:hypothetical protein